MASLISCPHCGVRPVEEFSIRGHASAIRPDPEAPEEAWHDYVYLRSNPRGVTLEHWYHVSGCRRFLTVERDTFTHEVRSVTDASLTAGEDRS